MIRTSIGSAWADVRFGFQLDRADAPEDVDLLLLECAKPEQRIAGHYAAARELAIRWPDHWRSASEHCQASVRGFADQFPDSLGTESPVYAGCAAAGLLTWFQYECREYNAEGQMGRLASFAYYALSYAIRNPAHRSVLALTARADLLSSGAAALIDGPGRLTTELLASLGALADYQDAGMLFRNDDRSSSAERCHGEASRLQAELQGTALAPRALEYSLNDLARAGHSFHDQMYRTMGPRFERGAYNTIDLAKIGSALQGAVQ